MIGKECPTCGEKFYGRSDKKFCSDLCRNIYNNKLNSDVTNYIRNINNLLRRNRRIIETLLFYKIAHASKQQLIDNGFSFLHYTSIEVSKTGKNCFYCYDYGYWLHENKCTFIRKKQKTLSDALRNNPTNMFSTIP